jgi:hypothetical protein
MTTRTHTVSPRWATPPFPAWTSALHASAHIALVAYGLTLLIPGVVPAPACEGNANNDAFLGWAGVTSASIAVLFLASAAVAHSQHPGTPDGGMTRLATGLAGCFAIAAVLGVAGAIVPVVCLIIALPIAAAFFVITGLISVFGLARNASQGWYAVIEGAAWVCTFLVLPLVTGLAYLTAAPLCFG